MYKKNLIAFLIIIGFVICYFTYTNYNAYHFQINGVIDSVSYDDKGYPYVVIKEETHGLPFGKEEIKVGDSISKSPQSYWVFQFRDGKKIGAYEW